MAALHTIHEQQEFLDYWMPKLTELHTPYVLVSVLDKTEKDRIDHVDISPKPDTKIEFLVYYKGLQIPYAQVTPLVLPQQPPARNGFTSVEWGGVIEPK